MVSFDRLSCNHEAAPTAVGRDLLFGWNYAATYKRDLVQSAYTLTLATDPQFDRVVFCSGRTESGALSLRLPQSVELCELTGYYWRVESELSDGQKVISPVAGFTTGIFGLGYWQERGCRWVVCRSAMKTAPEAVEFYRDLKIPRNKKLTDAKAYVFGSGFTYLCVNGQAPDDRLLAPANSVYARHCYYETYDIKSLLTAGDNELTVTVGSGYNAEYSQYGYRYFGKKGFIALFELKFADGSELLLPSDGKWSCRDSRVTRCGIYKGESFDAGKREFKKLPVTTDDAKAPWAPDGELIARNIPQIKVFGTVAPVASWADGDGMIFDFGQVSTALARITLRAKAGALVKLQHAEMILPDGGLDFYTNRAAEATDYYTCAGGGEERYMPAFTYHSFRYLRISGVEAGCLTAVEKCRISLDVAQTGEFECSDATVNRLHELMSVGLRNNFVSIPTDCAVRDERTPCAMDSQAVEKTGMYNWATAPFYTKWLTDVADCCEPEKGFGNPDWAGDVISLMWRIYSFYGDLRPAEKYFDLGVQMLFFQLGKFPDGLYKNGYGDWCNPNQNTWETFFGSVESVNTSLLYLQCRKLAALSRLLGRTAEETEKLEAAGRLVAEAFEKTDVAQDGTVLGGRNTEQAMPLYAKMLTGQAHAKALGKLIGDIERGDGAADFGIYGAMTLFELLGREGRADLALKILRRPDYPGYGFLLAQGATSLWEQWRYKGRMDSHSHGMFAGPDAAFYSVFAGISQTEPGFASVKIAPQLPDTLDMTAAVLHTPAGVISVRSEKLCGGYELKLQIPVGCRAEVIMPPLEGEFGFFDGERRIDYSPVMTLGSGIYDLRCVPVRLLQDH